jgi:hypothetical protein
MNVNIRSIWLAIGTILVVVLLFSLSGKFTPLAIRGSGALEDVVGRLGILFVLSVFAERTVQVYVSIFRNAEKQSLSEAVRQGRVVGDTELALDRNAALAQQRASTQKYSVLLALLIGILLGLAGISLLSALVDTGTSLNGLLRVIDILIVGGLIAGGSQPIHQIIETITDTFSLTRESLKSTTDRAVDNRATPQPQAAAIVPVVVDPPLPPAGGVG